MLFGCKLIVFVCVRNQVNCLDDNLANVTEQLKAKGMWENTLVVLSSDNGGYVGDYEGGCNTSTGCDGLDSTDSGHGAACFNGEAGTNNFPLRAGKYVLDAVWFVYTCRRLIDLSLIAGTRCSKEGSV